jgi:hypothetical protein
VHGGRREALDEHVDQELEQRAHRRAVEPDHELFAPAIDADAREAVVLRVK